MTSSSRTRLPEFIAWVASFAVGAFAVMIDRQNDEVQAAVLVIVVGGFLLGATVPRHAWRWAVVLGSSIFVGEVIGWHLGLVSLDVDPGWNITTLVAMIPAFIGTYIGVGVRRLFGAAANGL
jgi:hypothetical protein